MTGNLRKIKTQMMDDMNTVHLVDRPSSLEIVPGLFLHELDVFIFNFLYLDGPTQGKREKSSVGPDKENKKKKSISSS